MSKDNSITSILEEVRESMCDNYCKWSDLLKSEHMTDEEYDKYIEEHCDSCPLNRL